MTLTNADIATDHRDVEMWLMRGDFTGQFARWVVQQSPYPCPDITEALVAFDAYVMDMMEGEEVKKFTYDDLHDMIAENVFEKIPAIMALNVAKISSGPEWESRYRNDNTRSNPDFDFIGLDALARNIFYSIVRNDINWAMDEAY